MAGFYQKFEYGETTVHFAQIPTSQSSKKTIGMALLPKGAPFDASNFADVPILHASYAGVEDRPLKVNRQVQFLSGNLNTYLSDEDGIEYVHRLYYERKTGVFSVSIRCENRSKEDKTFEKLSAFSFGGFPASKNTVFHRISGAYSHAFALKSENLSTLGLSGFRNAPSLHFGSLCGEEGSYLPIAGLSCEGCALAVAMEPPQAWEMQLCRTGEGVNLLGGTDFLCGLSKRTLPAGGSYETNKVYFTLQPTLALAFHALVKQHESKLSVPPVEEELPVIFSTESISNINKLSTVLKNVNISTVILENSLKRPRTQEELISAANKFKQLGIRTEIASEDVTQDIYRKLNFVRLPEFGAATAIAASNLSRIIPARQMLIDVPIIAEEAEEKLIFKLCAAFVGRIRLHGEILKLDEAKTEFLSHGIRFYEQVKEIVKFGTTILHDYDAVASERPEGRQITLREYGEKRLLIIHFFECENAVRIPLDGYEIKGSFTSLSNAMRGEYLRIVGKSYQAGAFLLEKKREET